MKLFRYNAYPNPVTQQIKTRPGVMRVSDGELVRQCGPQKYMEDTKYIKHLKIQTFKNQICISSPKTYFEMF